MGEERKGKRKCREGKGREGKEGRRGKKEGMVCFKSVFTAYPKTDKEAELCS